MLYPTTKDNRGLVWEKYGHRYLFSFLQYDVWAVTRDGTHLKNACPCIFVYDAQFRYYLPDEMRYRDKRECDILLNLITKHFANIQEKMNQYGWN